MEALELIHRLTAALVRMQSKYENHLDEENTVSPREVEIRTWFATKVVKESSAFPGFDAKKHYKLIRDISGMDPEFDPPLAECPHCKLPSILYRCLECQRISCSSCEISNGCHIPCQFTFPNTPDGWEHIKRIEDSGKQYESHELVLPETV